MPKEISSPNSHLIWIKLASSPRWLDSSIGRAVDRSPEGASSSPARVNFYTWLGQCKKSCLLEIFSRCFSNGWFCYWCKSGTPFPRLLATCVLWIIFPFSKSRRRHPVRPDEQTVSYLWPRWNWITLKILSTLPPWPYLSITCQEVSRLYSNCRARDWNWRMYYSSFNFRHLWLHFLAWTNDCSSYSRYIWSSLILTRSPVSFPRTVEINGTVLSYKKTVPTDSFRK